MTSKHTPTPWSIEGFYIQKGNTVIAEIYGKESHLKAHEDYEIAQSGKANAAFIVRAVNAHEELLVSAKEAQAAIHSFMKNLNMKGGEVEALWQRLGQAIAKAERK